MTLESVEAAINSLDLNTDKVSLEVLQVSIPESNGVVKARFRIKSLKSVPVGGCEIWLDKTAAFHAGNIAYWVDDAYQNMGYATDAARLLFKVAAVCGLKTVTVICDSENYASNRVCEKLGYCNCGSYLNFGKYKKNWYTFRTNNDSSVWEILDVNEYHPADHEKFYEMYGRMKRFVNSINSSDMKLLNQDLEENPYEVFKLLKGLVSKSINQKKMDIF